MPLVPRSLLLPLLSQVKLLSQAPAPSCPHQVPAPSKANVPSYAPFPSPTLACSEAPFTSQALTLSQAPVKLSTHTPRLLPLPGYFTPDCPSPPPAPRLLPSCPLTLPGPCPLSDYFTPGLLFYPRLMSQGSHPSQALAPLPGNCTLPDPLTLPRPCPVPYSCPSQAHVKLSPPPPRLLPLFPSQTLSFSPLPTPAPPSTGPCSAQAITSSQTPVSSQDPTLPHAYVPSQAPVQSQGLAPSLPGSCHLLGSCSSQTPVEMSPHTPRYMSPPRL